MMDPDTVSEMSNFHSVSTRLSAQEEFVAKFCTHYLYPIFEVCNSLINSLI